MKVLAIDPGTLCAGYAILEKIGSKTVLLESGCLKLKRTDLLSQRIHTLYKFFEDKIVNNAITAIAIETPFFGRNAATFIKLGYVRGFTHVLAIEYACDLYEYAPTDVKKSVTKWGHAPKEQVATMVYSLFPALRTGLKTDVTDAIAIGLTCLWRN